MINNAQPSSGEPVYRVVRLVSTSSTSWEDAARRGVKEASKTNPGLTNATVSEMDTLVSDGQVVRYRLKLELAVQVDRERPNPVAGQAPVVVKRYLIVANQTLAGEVIPRLVAERVAAGPTEFHLLVPATRSKETQRLMTGVADPMSGYTVVAPEDLSVARARDRQHAEERLATFLDRLSEHSDLLTSEVAGHDPFAAIARVMERSSFDEIIISTLPGSVSRWLKMDLPSRVERAFSIPVVVINPPNQ
ncbi:MAG: dodecin domain-containing protein [Acidimicrobiales bacterium]